MLYPLSYFHHYKLQAVQEVCPSLSINILYKNTLPSMTIAVELCTFGETSAHLTDWNKRNMKRAAAIRCNNKTYHLGYFKSEIKTAKAGVYPPKPLPL
jgi:hypothetical protein